MTTFERLHVYYFHLHFIDWKHFNSPRLSLNRFRERNGQNEIEEVTTVTATVASMPMPDGRGGTLQTEITLFNDIASPRIYASLVDEVGLFNSAPERYWRELLAPLIETQLDSEKQIRKESKRREKRLRKGLDKLHGLDISSTK